MLHTRKQFIAALVGVAATVGLAACSSDSDKAKDTTAPTDSVVSTDSVASTDSMAPETTAGAPDTTMAPTTSVFEVSSATAAFAGEHAAELGAFAASVNTFSGEATTYLSDVSKAPSAAQTQTDAKALIAVLPARGTDPQLDLIRDVAESVDSGITKAAAGDQGGALADLTVAQGKGAALTELLTALMG